MTEDYDDGTRLTVDTDVVARWRTDFPRIDSERLLRSVPNPPEPTDEPWRRVDFREECEVVARRRDS